MCGLKVFNMERLFIPVLLGTGRADNKSVNAAKFVYSELSKVEGVSTKLFEAGNMGYSVTVPPWGKGGADEKETAWKEAMTKADGLVIVVPEYNHGYPGELKLVLDSLYKEYEKKAVTVCGVSSGGFGGTRVVDHIKPVLIELKMVPTRGALYFSKVEESFDENGNMKDPKTAEFAKDVFDELVWLAEALKDKKG